MRKLTVLLTIPFLLSVSGCSLSDLVDTNGYQQGDNVKPELVESHEGAKMVYRGAVAKAMAYLSSQSNMVARFTDELSIRPTTDPVDQDVRMPAFSVVNEFRVFWNAGYDEAHSARIQADQSIALLKKYAEGKENNILAHAYAVEAFMQIGMADNFCSGLPLSESQYGGVFVPGKGYPRDTFYTRAIQLFDEGIKLNVDSVPIRTLLLVGKARALNALGRYSEAADVVSSVADTDSAGYKYAFNPLESAASQIQFWTAGYDSAAGYVKNQKGVNGLKWLADNPAEQDSRINVRTLPGMTGYVAFPVPLKISAGNGFLVQANGAEARLIEAEAHLNNNEPALWLEKINRVRRLYKNLSGVQLADTVDPGTSAGRVDLLFRERAFVMYLTGRRLGDLRRMIRQYDRHPESVFPTGRAEGSQILNYGSNYVFAIGDAEMSNNPSYSKCEDYLP